MRIFKDAQILGLGRIGGANLCGLHGQICLSQAAKREQFLICAEDNKGVS